MTEEEKMKYIREYETNCEEELKLLHKNRKYALIYLGVLSTIIATLAVLKFMGYTGIQII